MGADARLDVRLRSRLLHTPAPAAMPSGVVTLRERWKVLHLHGCAATVVLLARGTVPPEAAFARDTLTDQARVNNRQGVNWDTLPVATPAPVLTVLLRQAHAADVGLEP